METKCKDKRRSVGRLKPGGKQGSFLEEVDSQVLKGRKEEKWLAPAK